jgi:hypothetical protein
MREAPDVRSANGFLTLPTTRWLAEPRLPATKSFALRRRKISIDSHRAGRVVHTLVKGSGWARACRSYAYTG